MHQFKWLFRAENPVFNVYISPIKFIFFLQLSINTDLEVKTPPNKKKKLPKIRI